MNIAEKDFKNFLKRCKEQNKEPTLHLFLEECWSLFHALQFLGVDIEELRRAFERKKEEERENRKMH
jgi:predicted HicB family RNase H-like nuclease